MHIVSLVFTAVGLSMDACAVSFAKGMCLKDKLLAYALRFGFIFGFFQAFMPLLGWYIGTYFESIVSSIDHWIAFVLLGYIGIHMLLEAKDQEDAAHDTITSISWKETIVMAIATSIDAFAVGISFAFLKVDIVAAIVSIGVITMALSFICVFLGSKIGGLFGKYAEIIGGCILIFIGTQILIEHLFL